MFRVFGKFVEIPVRDEDNSMLSPLLLGHSVSVACRKKNVQFGIWKPGARRSGDYFLFYKNELV